MKTKPYICNTIKFIRILTRNRIYSLKINMEYGLGVRFVHSNNIHEWFWYD